MESESLEALNLSLGDVRENVVTSGIELSSLRRGQRLSLGDEVVLQISRPCAPCGRMDEVRPGLQQELEGRRGMLASIERGGPVVVGDAVSVVEGASLG